MSTKRRVAVAASPEVKLRGQKRRKVSDDVPAEPEPSDKESPQAVSEVAEESGEPEVEFEGDSLQQAQDKIMSELTRLKDSDGQEVSSPFIGKPDRNLYRDYYEIIQHPVSLRSIQKRVRGTDSRKNSSKTTAYPTWRDFEEEVSYIWRNAREYNEDGSEIYILAGVLEEYFRRRVAEAKKLVPDPVQVDGDPEPPRIKLKMGMKMPQPMAQKLTLSLTGQDSDQPSKDDEQQPGVTVDDEALKRQQELVRAGSISQEGDAHRISPRTRSLRRAPGSPRSSTATTPSAVDQSQAALIGIRDSAKNDTSSHHPDPGPSQHLLGMSADLPRSLLSSTGGSPYHGAQTLISHPSVASPIDSLLRRPGQDASSALILNVQILTHPTLSLPQDFCLDIPPSSAVTQQTITINLPPSHHLLTVRPTLAVGSAQRPVKLVALLGAQRLHPSSSDAIGLAYDIQLHPGTNKVDLEAIAGPARGAPKSGPPGSEVDYERVTIFFNLLR